MRYAFLILLLGYPAGSIAQTVCDLRLRGRVINESKEALVGATVVLTESSQGETTNLAGAFEWRNLCAGRYTVEVRFIGYQTQRQVVSLPQPDEVIFTLVVDTKQLSEIVVTDTRVENPVSNATVIGSKELEAAQGKSLGEVLQTVPGVNSIQSGPAIFKPVIHGVHSQRVLILNNGIRQEGQQWGAEHAPEIDPFTAHTITVIKDAGAIKYGTDALGGVIIITPAELPEEPGLGGQVNLIGNSNNRGLTFSGMLEGGLAKPGWGWRVQGTGKYAGDSRTPDYVLSNTGFREQNFSAALGYHKEEKGLEVYYSHFNTTIGILRGSSISSATDLMNAIKREPPRFTSPFTYAIQEPRQEVRHDLVKLNGHIASGDHVFQAQYGFQFNNRQEYDFRRGGLRTTPALAFDLFTHTLDAEWETTRSKRTTCRGVNGMFQDNNKVDGTNTLPFIPNFTHYSAGAYWIEQFRSAQWDWELGARYDFRSYRVVGFDFLNRLYRSSLDFNNVSATAGGTYRFSARSRVVSTLSTAWRPPNVAELYSLGVHQSVASIEYGLLLNEQTTEVQPYRGSGVKSEQAVKWVSTFYRDTPALQWEISGYVNYIFNYIYLRPRGVTNTIRGYLPYFRYTQTDALFAGADLTLQKRWSSGFSTRSKVSFLHATDKTENDRLIFIPSNRTEISARYEKDLKTTTHVFAEIKANGVLRQFRAPRTVSVSDILENQDNGIDVIANDPRNFDFTDAPSGYVLLGVSVGGRIPLGRGTADVRLSAENLLNARYRDYTNRMRYYADERGRNIGISLQYAF